MFPTMHTKDIRCLHFITVHTTTTNRREMSIRQFHITILRINDVEIKKDLSQRERMVDFVSQIKNPYCYLDRGMVVKISFAGENRLEDTLKKCARTHRK